MAAYTLPGIFVMGCLVYLMESYVIRCPEQAEWNIRADIRCQNTTTYFCLYNYIANSYEEGCTGPDWDRSGSKRVYSMNFNRAPCNDTRYQPIKFVTNGNSDCIFRKSLCTDEGQILFSNGTTRTDSTCRCDYTQGYAFVTVPRSKCYCRPSEEDCSCYLKKCQGIGYNLSPDYECTKNITNNTDCPSMSANPSEDPHIDITSTGTPTEYDSYAIKRTYDVAILVSICLFVMIVIIMYIMFQERLPRCMCLSTEQNGNRPKEIVSSNTENNQFALRESDGQQKSALDEIKNNKRTEEEVNSMFKRFNEVLDNWQNRAVKSTGAGLASSDGNWKSALDELKDSIEMEGLETALKHLNDDLDKWKNEPVKLAVTGKSGVGKSSFINAIRNLKSGDAGFATSSSSGNTTTEQTIYKYPGNPMITLHDLPGFGTIELPTHEYEKRMELNQYDYILIFVGNIEETDIEIANKLKKMKKPFCFVRSKIDIDIQNAEKDGELENDIVEKIILKLSGNLENAGFNKANFFVISNHNQKICQFHDLVSYIQSNLPGSKYDAVMFSLLGELSVDVIDNKYKILKDRLWKISLASFALSIMHIYKTDIVLIMALICEELLLYHKVFGFEQQFIKDILKNADIRQKLNVSSIIEIQPSTEAMCTFAKIELEKLRTSEARDSSNKLIIPFIESTVLEWPAGVDTFRLLIQVLDGCRDDSILVHAHLMS